jgi:hypothetical protein
LQRNIGKHSQPKNGCIFAFWALARNHFAVFSLGPFMLFMFERFAEMVSQLGLVIRNCKPSIFVHSVSTWSEVWFQNHFMYFLCCQKPGPGFTIWYCDRYWLVMWLGYGRDLHVSKL